MFSVSNALPFWAQGPSPSIQKQLSAMETVQVHLKERLPPSWEVTTNTPETLLIVRKNSSEDCSGVTQRTALIDKDGSVQLEVHNEHIGLDHLVRTDLPCRVSLTSMCDFSEYVLSVVNVFRSYGHPTNRAFIQLHTPLTKLATGTVFDIFI